MKTIVNLKACACAIVSVSFAPFALAIDIGFEPGEGYTAGGLAGQPSSGTTWDGGLGVSVVDDGGNQFAQMPASDPSDFSNIRFTPSASDLGGSDAAAGIYSYSFQLRSENDPGTSNFSTTAIIRVAAPDDNSATIRLNVFDNGRVQFFDGATARNVLDGSSSNFDFDSTSGFVTVSGQINYLTDTYTMSFNGIDQVDGASSVNIGFNATGQSVFGAFRFAAGNTDPSDYRQLSFDNVNLSLIPEPSAYAALFGAFAVGFIFVQRRR